MRYWHWCLAVLLLAAPAAAQRQPVDLDVKFRAAERKELVDGDLKGAIEEYRQIVAQAGTNRSLAAKALLRMGECYQKQGDVEARRIYERVVREYPEQREVATVAQARLGRTATAEHSSAVSIRRVWAGDVLGRISPDGRYLSYVDWMSGNLELHDFATGTHRPLTGNKPGSWPASNEFAQESAISRDGAQITYSWYKASERRYELRLTSLRGSAVAPHRVLVDNREVLWIAPHDWSPDGKHIAVMLQRKDQIAQIGLVGVADGRLTVLKSVDWRGPTRVFFSPDGRFLGYDLPATGGTQRDVFVLAVDGSREAKAVAHPARDVMMGWSPNGDLLFASDRNGVTGLWSVPVRDGDVQGAAEVVQTNLGSAWSMGLTSTGAMYLGVSAGGQDITVATFDFETGKRLGPPLKPIERYVGSNREPAFSPDGRMLAYRATLGLSAQGGASLVIGVMTLETGEVREVVPIGLQYFNGLVWAPDGRSFAVAGSDLNGRQGVFRVDALTGAVEPIAVGAAGLFVGQVPKWSPDGKKIYYRRRSETGTTVVERDLASGAERLMLPEMRPGNNGFSVSPDGKQLAVITSDTVTKASLCLLVPVVGGPAKEILRVNQPQSLQSNLVAWSGDGRAVIVRRQSAAGSELLLVPVSGASPVKLEVDASEITVPTISVHPDGKQLAYTAGGDSTEVWVLENFLPAQKRKP